MVNFGGFNPRTSAGFNRQFDGPGLFPEGPGGFGPPPGKGPAELLSKADTNGDGSISKDEFSSFQPTKPDGTPLPTPSEAMKAKMFARLDQDGNGSISQTELQNAPPPPRGPRGREGGPFGGPGGLGRPPRPQDLLAKADTNQDGAISRDEFNAFQPTGPDGQTLPTPSDDQKSNLFARLDQNGDSSISQEELQNAPPPPPPPGGARFGPEVGQGFDRRSLGNTPDFGQSSLIGGDLLSRLTQLLGQTG